jgi:L-fuculose-phosphate aldolase
MSAAAGAPSSVARSGIIAVCGKLAETGLSPGKSGNVSVRAGDGMLITPTGIPYAEIHPDDLVHMPGDGVPKSGQRVPSSEWRMHQAIYAARPDAGAIVHTHSLHATALACLRRDIPAFHYMVAEFGGDRIACSPYATYGSETLAQLAVAALGDRHGCLLANHGTITIAATPRHAFERAVELEALAGQYVVALQLGEPVLLSEEDMKIVLDKFRTYGLQTEVNLAT